MSYLKLIQRFGIRTRVLLVTVVPLLVVILLLGYHIVDARLEDQRLILIERGEMTAKQLAMASEFWLFSSNQEQLQSIVAEIASDAHVEWAAVVDPTYRILAGSQGVIQDGLVNRLNQLRAERSSTLYAMLIGADSPNVSDFNEEIFESRQAEGQLNSLGWAVIELSLETSRQREREILFNSLGLILAGLLMTFVIGRYVSKSISVPIRKLTNSVSRLRRGELTTRVVTEAAFEIGDLEQGFNEMAESLQQAQQRLQEKIDSATSDLQATVAVLLEKNQELDEARQKAQEASQEKAAFLARMSHEIRTPLSAVIGFSQLLNETQDSLSAQESVRVIKQTAKQLLCVIDPTLTVSSNTPGGKPGSTRLPGGREKWVCI